MIYLARKGVSEWAKLCRAGKKRMTFTNTVAQPVPMVPPVVEPGQWYALYTCPRHEKYVAEQIERRRISCFVPLYRSIRKWKDRRKELQLALFPGYVFVRMTLESRVRVLQVPGAVHFVGFNGRPVPLPEDEIEV